MSNTQDPLARAYYAMLDAAVAMGKAERAYEQALAEETWEYTYHIKRQGEWEPTRNMETRREDWWDDRLEVVETVELLRASGFEARIVRRRVSPPEVISD